MLTKDSDTKTEIIELLSDIHNNFDNIQKYLGRKIAEMYGLMEKVESKLEQYISEITNAGGKNDDVS